MAQQVTLVISKGVRAQVVTQAFKELGQDVTLMGIRHICRYSKAPQEPRTCEPIDAYELFEVTFADANLTAEQAGQLGTKVQNQLEPWSTLMADCY